MAPRIYPLFLILLQGLSPGFSVHSCWADEKEVLQPLREKVEIAKASYPELIDQSFEALVNSHYLKLSANYYFAADLLNDQLEHSRQTLEELQEWIQLKINQTPESPSFLEESSKFGTMEYALDYEKSVASSLKKNLEDLTLGWKDQCTNESIQKFLDWNDPKRMLHLGHNFRRVPIPPKNVSVSVGTSPEGGRDNVKAIPSTCCVIAGSLIGGPVGGLIGSVVAGIWNTAVDLFRDKTGELRREQERLLSELSQFYTDTLERKRHEAFALSKKACQELFTLDFAEKLDQLVLQTQAHENQIAIEKVAYHQSWEEIKTAYSQFLLSREEEFLNNFRENYLTELEQIFLDVARLDRESKVFSGRTLGPLADEFEQVRTQNNEAKAFFKQRFWDALIEGDSQFHSGEKFYFANLEEMQNMMDRNFWHEFTGDLKAIFLFEQEPPT